MNTLFLPLSLKIMYSRNSRAFLLSHFSHLSFTLILIFTLSQTGDVRVVKRLIRLKKKSKTFGYSHMMSASVRKGVRIGILEDLEISGLCRARALGAGFGTQDSRECTSRPRAFRSSELWLRLGHLGLQDDLGAGLGTSKTSNFARVVSLAQPHPKTTRTQVKKSSRSTIGPIAFEPLQHSTIAGGWERWR